MIKRRFRRILLIGCSMMVMPYTLIWGASDQVICSSAFITTLVTTLVGSELSTKLIIPEELDPFEFRGLDEILKNELLTSSTIIVHKHQKALIRAIRKLDLKQSSLLILEHQPLTIPKNYVETASKLKKELSKLYPELDIYMAERFDELKERSVLLNNQYLAKGRDLNFANINCIVARRQADFATWLGVNVITTFGNESMITDKEKNKIIDLATQKGCWLIIANKYGGFIKIANDIRTAIDGEVIVLSDSPIKNEMIDMSSWETLLDENVSRVVDAILWH